MTPQTSTPPPAPPRAAASVVLLRDTAAGLEVFLLRRHGLSDVLGGAYVFPGGKVDPADATLAPPTYLDQSPAALSASLGEADLDAADAAGLYVAAVREAFEECGVLLAHGGPTGTPIDTAQATALCRAGLGFNDMLAQMALRLDTRSLAPWSRWITPVNSLIMNKRFDTRFFVAAVPADQTALHDDHETTASVWLSPRTALEQYWAGQIELAPPQIMGLAHLARYTRVDSVLQAAHARTPPVIRPESFEQEGVRVLCYPGDPRHSVPARALPGPTRMAYRNQRFEPPGGFGDWFA